MAKHQVLHTDRLTFCKSSFIKLTEWDVSNEIDLRVHIMVGYMWEIKPNQLIPNETEDNRAVQLKTLSTPLIG